MKEVKCFWCKSKGFNTEMEVEEKGTGKFNKNGSEKKQRKYFHSNCYGEYQLDKLFKEKEAKEWDTLYQYLISLHTIPVLDGRMIERIQDLRNGTVKIGNRKVKRYKEGVSYTLMYDTYKHSLDNIQYVLKSKRFETKWNEFAYIFSIMVNKLNEVQQMLYHKEKQETSFKGLTEKKHKTHTEEIVVKSKVNKKDELDISDFL